MTIDWTKPIETTYGFPARVIATDIKGDCPILIAIMKSDGTETVALLDEMGRYLPTWRQAVRNVPLAPVVRYFNLYSDGLMCTDHETRKEADYNAGPDRIACIRVEFKEGQFDE